MINLSENDIKIIAAAIPGVLAFIAALIVAYFNQASNRKNQERAEKNQQEMERLRSELSEKQAEKNALRDYAYEARKRLYEEIEPLLFQLLESSENALHRIYSIARTARAGDLREDGWLSREGYYALSTMYKLILPVAIVKLIQHKLTLVDLSVDPDISAQYQLAKRLYLSFTDDFVLANINPALPYDPNRKDWREKRAAQPEKYWRQGVPLGRLDNAADALLKEGGLRPWISFGDFQTAYKDKTTGMSEKFDAVATVILHFHPKMMPVMWRLLIAQAHIYEALLCSRKMQTAAAGSKPQPLSFCIEVQERAKFDWRYSAEEASDEEVLVTPFVVAHQYLDKCLGKLFIHPMENFGNDLPGERQEE